MPAQSVARGCVLALDASTYTGTVAVMRDGIVIGEESVAMRGRDEERLMPAVARVLETAGVGVESLDAIVCGEGPGSFTSLRIAASIAKGIAQARGLSLFAVSSLALAVAAKPREAGAYLVGLDALRGESYAELVHVAKDGFVHGIASPRLIASGELANQAARENATAIDASLPANAPHARGVARCGSDAIVLVDLVSWEPAYGRVAEAQARWEAAHGRPLASAE